MNLQEKIDKLPLNIEHHRKTYVLRFGGKSEYIFIEYFNTNLLGDYSGLLEVYNEDLNKTLSQRLEDIVDRALTIIENKEWENDK
jgi:hypothetical protein